MHLKILSAKWQPFCPGGGWVNSLPADSFLLVLDNILCPNGSHKPLCKLIIGVGLLGFTSAVLCHTLFRTLHNNNIKQDWSLCITQSIKTIQRIHTVQYSPTDWSMKSLPSFIKMPSGYIHILPNISGSISCHVPVYNLAPISEPFIVHITCIQHDCLTKIVICILRWLTHWNTHKISWICVISNWTFRP